MRQTVVPAQVTTVEDKIAGNLGLSQLLLLTVPVFGGCALFVALPPFFNYATYKIVLIVAFATLCGLLAIRIKGQILLFWLLAILRYNLRPQYYLFNKNTTYARRELPKVELQEEAEEKQPKESIRKLLPQLSTAELVRLEEIMTNPKANLHFTVNRKGELSARITEIR